MSRRLTASRFDAQAEEPLGPLANLVDIMLVFACGLIAALFASSEMLDQHMQRRAQVLEEGRELPELPAGMGRGGEGYESLGRVYRDPRTGKLILIGENGGEHERD
ncbi:DUF2149 domain-containing protein [Alkalilimnicola sp. S0819]|uniref:DUF2149 domain-containing protein n=1 Tax=Alkalilimnicola sp. S0819 TaxID=2613922 RepID=UPI0012626152|nr:DUF2149 domain-containing protein [Alkalilimnicola sp. S0819]KAB7623379.1 DUF2149 domain-containing protein [Alkalilimnicola sp. S0819]MPQ16921.1 DUF2149 domain-containing protein [Alkalilimnicola sp. S0819]